MLKSSFITTMGFLVLFSSCGQAPTPDNVISSLEGKTFDDMTGYFVYYRSRGSTRKSSIIFVSKYGLNCSPYAVDVIIKDQQVEFISIDKDLVIKSCGYDYIDEAQIKALVTKFVSYGVTLLGLDTAGNVYVNPSSQDLATLVKVKDIAKLNNAALFKPYKDDWYIKR